MKILNSTGSRNKSLYNFTAISFHFVSEPLITALWVQFFHMFNYLPTMTLSEPPLFRQEYSFLRVSSPKLFVCSHVCTSLEQAQFIKHLDHYISTFLIKVSLNFQEKKISSEHFMRGWNTDFVLKQVKIRLWFRFLPIFHLFHCFLAW